MDRQPVLEGERLQLRPLHPDDWDAFRIAGGDPAVWVLHPMRNRWQEPALRAFFDDALAQGGALAVIDRASGALLGSSRFQNHDPVASEVEIGWTFLATSHWGGSTNREMKRLMLAHALRYVETVVFRVGETNLRSRRAMEKIGGALTEREDFVDSPTGPIRHVVYAITRESFAVGPLAKSG